MSSKNTYLHIGCHKSGSTFLQKEVLPNLKNISTSTFYDYHDRDIFEKLLYICRCADIYYDNQFEMLISNHMKKKMICFCLWKLCLELTTMFLQVAL